MCPRTFNIGVLLTFTTDDFFYFVSDRTIKARFLELSTYIKCVGYTVAILLLYKALVTYKGRFRIRKLKTFFADIKVKG